MAALVLVVPGFALLWIVGVGASLTATETLTLCLGSAAFFLAAAWAVSMSSRMAIVADKDGLHWRRVGRWHHAAWSDVRGYYDQRKPHSEGKFAVAEWQQIVEVRTENNTITKLVWHEHEWTNERPLRVWIQQHATEAKRQSWAEMRKNPEDWPEVFHYNTTFNRNSLRWLHQAHWIGLAAVTVYFGWQWQTTHTLPGWEWLITPSGLFFVSKQILLLALYPSSRRTKSYLDRKVRADMDGLIFSDGDKRERVAWGEIIDYYQQDFRSLVVTERGEWDFLGTLTGFEGLRRIIRRYAVNAGQMTWRKKDKTKTMSRVAWYSK